MSRPPRNTIDLNDDSAEGMSLIKQEAKVLTNKVETQKQIDNIIKGFKNESLTRKETTKFAKAFRPHKKTLDIESEIAKITATAEVRLTRSGRSLTTDYQEYLGKVNNIFDDIRNASSRLEVDEVEKTLKDYKKIVKETKNLSKDEKREIKNVIKETEYAVKAVKSQKLARGKILADSIKENLPDIAGLTAAIFGDNPLAAWAGGVAGDYMRQRKEIKKQEKAKRLALLKDERDKSIGKSIDLRRDRDDEIIDRKDNAKEWMKGLFSRKEEPVQISYQDDMIERDDDSDDMGSFLDSLHDTLIDAITQGIAEGMGYKADESIANKDFESKSKLKRDTDEAKKNDKQIITNTDQTNKNTGTIASELSESRELAEETHELLKDTNEMTDVMAKIEKAKSIYNILKTLADLGANNQDIMKKYVTGRMGIFGKGIEKVVNLFGKMKSTWEEDLLNAALDQKDIQLEILKKLGGKWVERDQQVHERGLVVSGGLQDRTTYPPPPPFNNDDDFLSTLHVVAEELKHQNQTAVESSLDDEESLKDAEIQNERIVTPLEGIYELMLAGTPPPGKNDSKGKSGSILDSIKDAIGIKKGGVVSNMMNMVSGITGINSLNDYETVNISDASIKDLARAIGSDDGGGIVDDIMDMRRGKRRGKKGRNIPKGVDLPNIPQLPAPYGKPTGKLGKIKDILAVRKMNIAGLVGLAIGTGASYLASEALGPENDPQGMVSNSIGLATDIGVSMGIPALMAKFGGMSGLLSSVTAAISGAGGLTAVLAGSVAAAPAIVTAAAVTVATATGYGIGTLVNDYVIEPATKTLTGGKNTNLGDWFYDVTHPSNIEGDVKRIQASSQRNVELDKLNTEIKDMKEEGKAKMIASSVNSAVTNIGGSTTNISMPVSAYDNDRGTNLLTQNLSV